MTRPLDMSSFLHIGVFRSWTARPGRRDPVPLLPGYPFEASLAGENDIIVGQFLGQPLSPPALSLPPFGGPIQRLRSLSICVGFCDGNRDICAGRAGLLADAVLFPLCGCRYCVHPAARFCSTFFVGSASATARHLVEHHASPPTFAAQSAYDGLCAYVRKMAESSALLPCPLGCRHLLPGTSVLYEHLLSVHPASARPGPPTLRELRLAARRVLGVVLARALEIPRAPERHLNQTVEDPSVVLCTPPLSERFEGLLRYVRFERRVQRVPFLGTHVEPGTSLGPRWVPCYDNSSGLSPVDRRYLGLAEHLCETLYLYPEEKSLLMPHFDGTFYLAHHADVCDPEGGEPVPWVTIPLPPHYFEACGVAARVHVLV